MANDKKPCKSGLDFIRGRDWKPMLKTRKGWEQYGKRAAKSRPEGCNTPVIGDFGEYFRLNFAGMPTR